MKAKLALVVAALQVLVLGFMGGQREWILRFGPPLVLRTAPLDPDDPMRGAFVRLGYEISVVPAEVCRGEVAKWAKTNETYYSGFMAPHRDAVVYAALKPNAYGLADLDYLSDTPPANGSFIRGRVASVSPGNVQVRYGIEAYFMHKDAARRMETTSSQKAGAPMDVTVAVGSSGIAVLKDTAWEPLGLTLTFDRPPPRTQNDPQRWQQRPLTGLTVVLHNYSDKDVAIVDQPGGGSFNLVPTNRGGNMHYKWAGRQQAGAHPGEINVVVLKPGATHETHLDLTQRDWWILDTNKPNAEPMPFQKVPQQDTWGTSFRIEYAPPPADTIRHLPNAGLVRHAPLRSRAFNANQGVD